MVNDTEPRYRLVDANGNVVGSLYAESDGTLKLQEGTSGSDNEVSVATDGTFTAPAVSTDEAITKTLTYSDLSEGVSSNLVSADIDGDRQFDKAIQYTDGVSTSSTVILTNEFGGIGNMFLVAWIESVGNKQVDLLLGTSGAPVKTIDSVTLGNVPSRSYQIVGSDLEMSVGSGSVDVVAKGISMFNLL